MAVKRILNDKQRLNLIKQTQDSNLLTLLLARIKILETELENLKIKVNLNHPF